MSIKKKHITIALLLAIMSGFCAISANAQSWQKIGPKRATTKAASQARAANRSRQPKKTVSQPVNPAPTNRVPNPQQTYNNSAAIRGSINFPTAPAVESPIYPIVRESAQYNNPNPTAYSDWEYLGNGTRIHRGPSQIKPAQQPSSNKLSPEVLETIRQLKAEYSQPTPMYQMIPADSYNQSLIEQPDFPDYDNPVKEIQKPITNKQSNSLINPYEYQGKKTAIDVESSTLTFPADKNIKIRSLDFRQTQVSDALRSLARIININLMLSSEIPNDTVTVLFNDVTMEEAFNTILVNFDLSFSWEGKILRIFPSRSAPVFTRIFSIQHTNAADLEQMINRLLSERGKLELDPRTNSIIITDTLAKLTEIENMLPKIDVKETSLEITSRPVTEVFYLNYADAGSIEEAITMISENAKISKYSRSAASQAGAAGGESTTGRLDMMIITDTLNNLDRIRELIDKLDVAPIQVTIDAHIYEIDKQKEIQFGVNWSKIIPVDGTSNSNLFEATISPSGGAAAGGTGVFRFGSLTVNQFQAVLSTLNTNSFAKVLSNPVITTLNNHTANISVGQSISYISASTVSEGGQVSNTVSQAKANIVLDVTPSVTGNDEVFLNIKPTIANVLGYTTLGGNSTPNLSERTAETQVICKNNQTIVIGGMMKTDKSDSISKVPVLGNLPGIGKLFQSKQTKEITTELIIFITPHIIRTQSTPRGIPMFSNAVKTY